MRRQAVLIMALALAAVAGTYQLHRSRQEAALQAEVAAARTAAAIRGRAVPAELLALPRAPEQDELGYHGDDIDKLALVGMLEAKRYVELEARLQSLWQETQGDIRHEYRLLDAYYAFWRDDAAFRPLFEAWIRARPGSAESNFAAALHFLKRAQEARGTKWAKQSICGNQFLCASYTKCGGSLPV